MAQAVRDLPPEIKKRIEINEWDLRTQEGLSMFKKLKARSLPAIVINGRMTFEAIIPAQEELIREIERASQEQNNQGE
jgi:hypothetical protein